MKDITQLLSKQVIPLLQEKEVYITLKKVIPASNRNFKSSKQKEMVLMAIQAEQDFICILSIGGGKTLCFELPILHQPNSPKTITIVMVLFMALLDKLLYKAQSKGIQAHK